MGDIRRTTEMSSESMTAVFSSPLHVNGVTTAGGRLFAVSQGDTRTDGQRIDAQLVEIIDERPTPYAPDGWRPWEPGSPVENGFVGLNSLRVGPDGVLWLVDRGTTGVGQPRIPSGPRLIGFDIASDRLQRSYDLSAATRPWSFVDDVRFHGPTAYLTDCGAPAIIVLDLAIGTARRVLEGHPATVAQRRLRAEHRDLTTPSGSPVNIHADKLEVSPDGAWLYFQPCCGQMFRIATGLLDDPATTEQALGAAVEPFADTPSTGGTAIDEDGRLYLSDVEQSRILTISPNGDIDVLLQDPRLARVDAMWITDDGDLLIPAAQLNRTPGLNGGVDIVRPPCTVYSVPIGRAPSRS